MQSSSSVTARLSTMMFLQFFVWGAWYVTLGPYMARLGLTDSIGHAYSVGPIAAILSPFFLGLIADRFFSTEKVLGVLHIIGGLALLAAPQLADQAVQAAASAAPLAAGEKAPFINPLHIPFLAILLLHMLCYMPTLGLTNTLAFHHVTNPQKQFPFIRVFGTIGWIVAGLAVGYLAKSLLPTTVEQTDKAAVDSAIAAMPHFFYFAGGAGIMLGIFSFTLPHTPPPAKGKEVSAASILGVDSLALLRDPSFLVFIICSFLICIPLAAYYAYASFFAGQMGVPADEVPVKMSFGQMSEIVFMLVMPLCFARLGIKWMLAVGMLAWVARYALFALGADDHVRWMLLGGILLHGICYDFFFVTGQIYVDKKASPEIRGQAQGFLVLITQGLGMLIGAQTINRVVTHFTAEDKSLDWRSIWFVPAAAAAVILVVFVALFREPKSDAK